MNVLKTVLVVVWILVAIVGLIYLFLFSLIDDRNGTDCDTENCALSR